MHILELCKERIPALLIQRILVQNKPQQLLPGVGLQIAGIGVVNLSLLCGQAAEILLVVGAVAVPDRKCFFLRFIRVQRVVSVRILNLRRLEITIEPLCLHL